MHSKKIYEVGGTTTRPQLIVQAGTAIMAESDCKAHGVAVFGPRGSAKSFLLCHMLHDPVAFRHISLSERVQIHETAITRGVDCYHQGLTPSEWARLWNINDVQMAQVEKKIYFFDVEGLGENSIDTDSRIALPVLLACQDVVYNFPSLPTPDEVRRHLQYMIQAATLVTNPQQQHLFGNLHLVIRNYIGEISPAATSVWLNNLVPQNSSLRDSFQSVNLYIFPPPNMHPGGIMIDTVGELFNNSTFSLVRSILLNVRDDRNLPNGVVTSGPILAQMIEQFVASTNEDHVWDWAVGLDNIKLAFIQTQAQAARRMFDTTQSIITLLNTREYINDNSIRETISQAQLNAQQHFRNRLEMARISSQQPSALELMAQFDNHCRDTTNNLIARHHQLGSVIVNRLIDAGFTRFQQHTDWSGISQRTLTHQEIRNCYDRALASAQNFSADDLHSRQADRWMLEASRTGLELRTRPLLDLEIRNHPQYIPYTQSADGYVHTDSKYGNNGPLKIEINIPQNVEYLSNEVKENTGNGDHGCRGPYYEVCKTHGRILKVWIEIWQGGRHGFLGTGGNSWHGATLTVHGRIRVP